MRREEKRQNAQARESQRPNVLARPRVQTGMGGTEQVRALMNASSVDIRTDSGGYAGERGWKMSIAYFPRCNHSIPVARW